MIKIEAQRTWRTTLMHILFILIAIVCIPLFIYIAITGNGNGTWMITLSGLGTISSVTYLILNLKPVTDVFRR